ncbi:MAG TPA: hypothetical protein VFK03_02220 [Candidatus Saccharimonadales bacterium]|nr:hypothetical protein [Candidatus Saccharimonadales bacterium]
MGTISGTNLVYTATDLNDYNQALASLQAHAEYSNILQDQNNLKITFDVSGAS